MLAQTSQNAGNLLLATASLRKIDTGKCARRSATPYADLAVGRALRYRSSLCRGEEPS